jgi:hypothetical protein
MECTYLMHPFFAILHALWPWNNWNNCTTDMTLHKVRN